MTAMQPLVATLRRVLRLVLRTAGWLLLYATAFLLGGVLVSAPVDAFDGSDTASRVATWAGGLAAVLVTWRLVRRARRRWAASEATRLRTAGEQLRAEDLPRYKELLAGATETLSVTDPDLYAGRRLEAAKEAEPRPRGPAWKDPTPAQRTAVDILTGKHGRATLVRSLDDGSAEVVGVSDCVGFRYQVDAAGFVALVGTDDSDAAAFRIWRRLAGIGILMFIGSIVLTFALDGSGSVPGWLVPFPIVGFILAFLGIAANVSPRNFVEDGERWDAHGSGWD